MEIKLNDMQSVLDMVKSLLLNHYKVTVETIYEPWPRDSHIDYFMLKYDVIEVDEDEDD